MPVLEYDATVNHLRDLLRQLPTDSSATNGILEVAATSWYFSLQGRTTLDLAGMADTSLDEPGPPWYVKDEHGRIDALAIPERLRTHPEIQRRGIVLSDPLKPVRQDTKLSLDLLLM